MIEIDWKSIEDIKHHGADWCVSRFADHMPLEDLKGLVERINAIIAAAVELGRNSEKR